MTVTHCKTITPDGQLPVFKMLKNSYSNGMLPGFSAEASLGTYKAIPFLLKHASLSFGRLVPAQDFACERCLDYFVNVKPIGY